MGTVAYQHQDLAAGRWAKMPLALQMGNIGSEVSRALKWQQKGKDKLKNTAIDRALELFDLSLDSTRERGRLLELCRAREEFCDYFFGGNSFQTDPIKLQRNYDEFISLAK